VVTMEHARIHIFFILTCIAQLFIHVKTIIL
jgi:hypothetical protein